ncbi:hypothetical protein [Hymenobacter sp. YC55]|uniref:hypothetical protein n=1 Tax=Hymenobacter sp. YC55 TaxID=3034019 RepID=UPI0023F7FD2A|nr:hypothetical protein [Hymenobacter sp. YC55]MDF7812386.1 hypothetical protein [Hymenobacter sp. YC55]
MAEPTNPLFEDEKEFLERQKLEYERALMGEVDGIKEDIKVKTQQIGKYAAIGAGVIGSVWLISKAFGGPKKYKKYKPKQDRELGSGPRTQRSARSLRKGSPGGVDYAINDDLGARSGHYADRGFQTPASERADIAPDVYHAQAADLDSDPFRPLDYSASRTLPTMHQGRSYQYDGPDQSEGASSIVADTFRAFLQSDTGKMLIAQATAVLMAVVAKKVGEYMPMFKNPDLATTPHQEPETRDIDFTFHDDDANAPHQPL